MIDIKKIAEEFGLSVSSFEEQGNVVLSRVIILDGNYVLRGRKLHAKTLANLEREQELLDAAAPLLDIAAPRLLTSKNGLLYIIQEDTVWTAYPIILGETLCNWWEIEKLPSGAQQEAFETLGRIHAATKGKLAGIDPAQGYRFTDDVARQIENMRPSLSVFEIEKIDKALAAVRAAETLLGEEDTVFVHGDFHPGNCVVKEGKIVGILDTDWSRKGSVLEDLAYGIINYTRICSAKRFIFDQKKFEQILEWYGLPVTSVSLLKECMILYALFDLHGLLVGVWPLENKKQITSLQRSLLKELCEQF